MSDDQAGPRPSPGRRWAWIAGVALVGVALIAAEVAWTRPVRGAVRTFTGLITAANRGDLDSARGFCTDRYLQAHPLRLAGEGGLVGLPRSIHMNYQAWGEGREVWICPTKGVGPVYRLVPDGGSWKFDGMVGQLIPGGRIIPPDETAETVP